MSTASSSQATRVVMYVEDHPVNALVMEALFERRTGERLVIAIDGRDALSKVGTVRPALLLIDLRLPDCHGIELLEMLRQRGGWHDVPAVAVTAEPGFELAGTGFCEVWEKPLNLDRVLRRLDELLEPERHGLVRRGTSVVSDGGTR